MKALLTAVYSVLTAPAEAGPPVVQNALHAAVGGRIYQIEAPASSALPLVVFAVTGVTTEHSFGGRERTTATVDLTVYGRTSGGVAALGTIEDAANGLLDQAQTAATGYDRMFLRTLSRGRPTVEGEYLRLDSMFELVAFATT